ncbi:MAG TPA: hypothetical protein VGF86_11870 [Candidatus Tumulicola sp.]|jgi:hypothetical protein
MFSPTLLLAAIAFQATPVPSPNASPGLGSPPGVLTVSPGTVELNPAQQRVLAVEGAVAPLTVTLDRRLVLTNVDPAGTTVTITATQATGNDVLHLVDSGGAQADVPIRVAFNAGTIAGQATLKVTGNPVDPAWLARQATAWVGRLTQALPGAQTAIGFPDPAPGPLAAGDRIQLSVPVQISSGGDRYFPQSGATILDVQNVAVDAFSPGLLFYDDDPEHVVADGVLFRGTVTAAQAARLYYYHDDAAEPRRIVIALAAVSGDPTSVQLIDSSAGPNIDVMQVGHAVSRNFLTIQPRGEGVIADLAGDEPLVLHDVPMSARQGVAGAIDMRVLTGGPITVTVLAASPGVDPRSLLGEPVLPDDGHHRTGVFRVTGFGVHALSYAAGGPDAKLVIGDTDPTAPNADASAPGHDYGDYGVLHSVDLTLSNPGPTPAPAYLYFRPIGGIARASFLIDGSLVELGCVRQSVPYQISAFGLAPGQTSHASLSTMTDGGSFFPAEIGVSATPPQPTAPPIGAPDGCFPKPAP